MRSIDWKAATGRALAWATLVMLLAGVLAAALGSWLCWKQAAHVVAAFLMVGTAGLVFLALLAASGPTTRSWFEGGGEGEASSGIVDQGDDSPSFDFGCDF
jgi:hypothetical protein